jgi:aspartyl-tRNA(Asn)/glutamyl-tRNA(Gln) amidotransferase subunit A
MTLSIQFQAAAREANHGPGSCIYTSVMGSLLGNVRSLRSALVSRTTTPTRLAHAALHNANRNPGENTYLWRDAEWTLAEAARAEGMPAGEGGSFGDGRANLWGLPVSVKDCFDLAGAPTTCGTNFYAERNGMARQDSWVVERLRAQGAIIVGKTHLHPLAYGITGENPDFGDCLQPGREAALTGGSSSGAAASVMEGSAVAAIGTDTGGSIRVPAALCGLAGYRASIGRGNWRGGAHLAESFDTLGWLFADLEEGPLLASLFASSELAYVHPYRRFAYVGDEFLNDCDPEVRESYRAVVREFEELGMNGTEIDVPWWDQSRAIFAPIQSWEAAALHRGNFDKFEDTIRDRLEQGSRITLDEIGKLRVRHEEFRAQMDELFASHEVVMLPAAPVATLRAGADHGDTRARLLRYTTPFSLAGVPAVTVPTAAGGVQIAAAREEDEALLQLVAVLGAKRKAASSVNAEARSASSQAGSAPGW